MTIKRLTTAIVLVLTTQLVACASGSPPRQEMALTQTSIRNAEAAGAVNHASKPLRAAQQKVTIAQRLIDNKKYDDAKRQLDLAMADAELAEATAEAEKSRIAKDELHESINLMKEEIARVQDIPTAALD